uniref:Uncharacterized protein n=1 Tax=Serinus canaria TaxID=9135 RepID=A0A8C9UFY6_SERCA
MPGGGIPMGAPRPGGIPMGGPIGGLIKMLLPILHQNMIGAPAMLAVAAAAAAATVPRPWGYLTCWDGPPTPLTGPANPAGACGMGVPAGTPLPAALPTPGPPAAPARGGPSTVMDTRFSPRSNTRPRTRFSSRPRAGERARGTPTAHLILRNSSQSQRMRFMCLSKALNVPMKTRPSCRMHRMR